jgi:hypothetical protein
MSDQVSVEIPVQGVAGDDPGVGGAALRLARAAAALLAAEQEYRDGHGDAAANEALAASQEVIAARVALSQLLVRRGLSPHPGHRAVDEFIMGESVGIHGG